MTPYMKQRQSWPTTGKPPKEKKQYKIPQVSKKRQRLNREYSSKSVPVWKGNPCAINAPGCTGQAQGIHHLKGKVSPELLLNAEFWKPACNHCNSYIEANDAWAREHGFKLSKFN